MNPIEARQLKKWLDDNNAVMIAMVELGSFIVLIRSPGSDFLGVGESEVDLEQAIREAQHSFDARVMQAAMAGARVVGSA